MTRIAEILERSRANGPMRDAPLAFVVVLANAVADATIDFIIRDPDNADAHASDGFDGSLANDRLTSRAVVRANTHTRR